jgi:hypothetical protein
MLNKFKNQGPILLNSVVFTFLHEGPNYNLLENPEIHSYVANKLPI